MASDSVPPVDHLTALPSELLQNIASYLYATHEPNKAFDNDLKREKAKSRPRPHDLESLAATCHTCRNEVNDWALHFLVEHKAITAPENRKSNGQSLVESAKSPITKASKRSKPGSTLTRNNLRITKSQGLLSWSERHCVFCGKGSARSAIMMNELRCCKDCDRVEWKDKITKTVAMKEYDLKDYQLLPHLHQKADLFKQLGIPRLRYGTYVCQGGVTTMFMREHVRRFAELVHGGLKEHMAQRERQREKLRKTKEKNKEIRAEKQAARVVKEAGEAQQRAGQAAVEREAMNELVETPHDVELGSGIGMEDFILIE